MLHPGNVLKKRRNSLFPLSSPLGEGMRRYHALRRTRLNGAFLVNQKHASRQHNQLNTSQTEVESTIFFKTWGPNLAFSLTWASLYGILHVRVG
jgi:hypothetical protein